MIHKLMRMRTFTNISFQNTVVNKFIFSAQNTQQQCQQVQ